MSPTSHLRRVFALLLACLWLTTASFAEHLSADFPLCQPDQSPCCPQPANNAPESCPACHATTAAAEKQESQSEEARLTPRSERAPYLEPALPTLATHRELTQGLRYRPAVFQLKDDLRI